MLELEPPELPDDPPEDPDEPPDEPPEGLGMLGDGMLLEEELAQPPMRKAEAPAINVVCAAMTNSRRSEWRVDIACSPMRSRERTPLNRSTIHLSLASSEICDPQAEHLLINDQPTFVTPSVAKFTRSTI